MYMPYIRNDSPSNVIPYQPLSFLAWNLRLKPEESIDYYIKV